MEAAWHIWAPTGWVWVMPRTWRVWRYMSMVGSTEMSARNQRNLSNQGIGWLSWVILSQFLKTCSSTWPFCTWWIVLPKSTIPCRWVIRFIASLGCWLFFQVFSYCKSNRIIRPPIDRWPEFDILRKPLFSGSLDWIEKYRWCQGQVPELQWFLFDPDVLRIRPAKGSQEVP